MSKWQYFTDDELRCKGHNCCGGEVMMDATFMYKLDSMRRNAGFPFIVTSGYRCPDYNDKISSTGRDGPHTTGKAVDIAVRGTQAHTVLKLALASGITGVGVDQKGESRFIHLDSLTEGTRPWVWSY